MLLVILMHVNSIIKKYFLNLKIDTHTHTHTTVYSSVDFVRDNPGERVPAETFEN